MKNILIALCLITAIGTQAQSPEVRARAAFLKAQELYGNGEYTGAITKLNSIKEMLGTTNPRVEYLLCQSHFANKDAEKAEASMKSYFEMADESDPNYNAMLMMIEEIEEKKEQFRMAKMKEEEEAEIWNEALSMNTAQGFEIYLNSYPNGNYREKAKQRLLSLPVPSLIDYRDNEEYKTVRIGEQVWMAENLRVSDYMAQVPKVKEEGLEPVGLLYHYSIKNNICPTGWRLPSIAEVEQLFRSAGVIVPDREVEVGGPSYVKSYSGVFTKFAGSYGKKWIGGNSTGFNLLPVKLREATTYLGMNPAASFWTSDGYVVVTKRATYTVRMTSSYNGATLNGKVPCRCIRDL